MDPRIKPAVDFFTAWDKAPVAQRVLALRRTTTSNLVGYVILGEVIDAIYPNLRDVRLFDAALPTISKAYGRKVAWDDLDVAMKIVRDMTLDAAHELNERLPVREAP